ncbi:MAG: cation:proton antiporter [Nanoarchaeota archaeon]|nr:cation:proton antiporter [Nanoarchaeota archaeon]
MSSFFLELSLVMLLTFVLAYIANKIKQPLLVGYIFAGIIAGPLFFNILSSTQGYETFSHIGISLLLFIVGLHLNLKLIKEVGFISMISGFGQVLFTSIIGVFIALFLGYSYIASFFIAISLTFSSTIIIVKLLSDKKDLDTLYGKISMGFLIVQDLIAVVLLMIIGAFLNSDSENLYSLLIKTFAFIIVSLILTYIISRYIMPKFLESISKSNELFFLFIIMWCFGISSLFDFAGFSLEVGALLAGIVLASSPFQFEISARIKPLRDFFIVMFFILLGSQMLPPVDGIENMNFSERLNIVNETFSPILIPAILFSLFVLIGNPLIVLIIMSVLGYPSRVGFLAGLTVAQISEFSLILALLANQSGYLSLQEVSMITLVGIITITASTYLILNGDSIYKKLRPFLKKFEKTKLKAGISQSNEMENDVIVFGYDRIGFSLLRTIKKLDKKYLIVDYNPIIVKKLTEKDFRCIYGDASDIEFLEDLKLESAKLIISTIPDYETSMILIKEIKKVNLSATIILTSNDIDNALELYKSGADYVILPHFLGGEYVSTLIENFEGNFDNVLKEKVKHINDLKQRKEFGHHHPKH